MKKFLKILGIALGVIVLLIGGVLGWVAASGLPIEDTGEIALPITGDSVQLARGQKVVETICASCHRAEDATLSGKLFLDEESGLGVVYAANLTRHPEAAISAYSDGELAYLLRTGIKRNGSFAGPYMIFPKIADKDLAGIIAYLRAENYSTEPRAVRNPAPRWGFVGKALLRFGIFAPIPDDGKPIQAPDPTDELAYGRYLATAVYQCANCHSASFESNDPLQPEASEGFFGGGNAVEEDQGKLIYSANLTPHATGLGNWTYEEFVAAVKSGIGQQRRGLDPAMPRFVHLSAAEVRAIWTYLQTVPALDNDVKALPTSVDGVATAEK